MSLSSEERDIMVRLECERALKLLDETEKIASLEMWGTACSRLYYALFHSVSALLIKDGHSVGSHKGANLRFGQNYVKTGIFPSEAGRLYTQMLSLRERADYNILFEVTKEEFEQMFSPVVELVHMIIERVAKV